MSVPIEAHGGVLTRAVRELDEAGVHVDDIGFRRPTLDEVFLAITGQPIEGADPGRSRGMSLRWWLTDSIEMVRRNLRHIRRTPELLLDVTVQPIMFVLLFRYVFGGAIPIQGTSYVNYLMAGIFVQTIVFATIDTGILLANDLSKGMIDRFRSLPMSQSAVITGRTFTDLLRGMLAIAVMTVVGLAVGFRPQGTVLHWLGAARSCCLRLRAGVGGRGGGRLGPDPRSGAGPHLPRRLPADLREQRVRAHRHHAELAPGVRRSPAHDPHHQRGPQPDPGRVRWPGPGACAAVERGPALVFFPLGPLPLPAADDAVGQRDP